MAFFVCFYFLKSFSFARLIITIDMKQILILFASILLLTQCSKKEDSPPPTLEGTWTLTAATCSDGVIATNTPGMDLTIENYTFQGENFSSTLTFQQPQGVFFSIGVYDQVRITDGVSSTMQIENFMQNGDWTPHQELIFDDFNSAGVVELTNSTLTIEFNLSEFTNKNGAQITETATIFYDFVRQ